MLAEEPLCRQCKDEGRITPAVEVDHITPLRQGGTNDRSNLQPLCRRHHSQKTCRENGGFGNARGGR